MSGANRGVGAGAIAFRNKAVQTVKIENCDFNDNSYQQVKCGDDSGTVLIHIGQNTQNIIITQCTFNKCICGSDQMNKTSGALFLYIISKDWNGIIDLSNSSFIDNKGTESGGIFIKHNQEYSRIYQRLKLDNQYFFGNNIDGRSPTAHIDINSNIDLSSLFNSKGSIYGKEIEVDKDSAVDDDEPFTLIKGQTYSNSLHFHSINAAMKFTNRFIGWQNQLTITSGNHIESVNLISEQNHSFKGRKYLEDSEQANLYSFGIQPIFSLSTGILNLKWLTLTKSQLNDTPILIRIENGNLQLFECQFIGVKSKQDKSSFIQIGDKIADVNNVDILRCSFSEGQFGKDSGAVSIIGFGRMWIEGSQFIGNETVQMGSFIKVINNNDTNIVNCIFKDSSFSQSTDSAISIQDINNHLSIILCTFTNLRSNNIQTPAISCIQRINSSIITLQFNSFIRCGGGRVDSGAISVICDEFIHFTSLHINSCIFHKNTGMLSGAVYIDSFNYLNSYIQFKGNLLRQNIANSLIANDIYVKNENNMIFENNIGNRSSGNIIIGNGDKSQEIYGYQQLYKSREQVHVRKEGLNADEQDILIYGVGLGIFEHPLRTLDYAVNCRDISQKLDIILYRQRYDVQNTLYILDDRISIHDTDICGFVGSQYVEQQNPYSYIAAGQGGHIQMWGITFIQLSNGETSFC
ncbi:MAG: hypothetical protein EZS28_001021 [Streblomastix strix]|uniref:Uncharacterized protein n=1 Tax=Streblomastix strix TaxID=222440 RepID=A0A5J4X881_9EUKA|nr:MAG: hypothetical protein EZS28_001021 [Streblomastix strix]